MSLELLDALRNNSKENSVTSYSSLYFSKSIRLFFILGKEMKRFLSLHWKSITPNLLINTYSKTNPYELNIELQFTIFDNLYNQYVHWSVFLCESKLNYKKYNCVYYIKQFCIFRRLISNKPIRRCLYEFFGASQFWWNELLMDRNLLGFIKLSSFVSWRRTKSLMGWNNVRMSKWW